MTKEFISKTKVIENLKLQIDPLLDEMNKGIEMNDLEVVQKAKDELQAIHDSLVALGHWEGKVKTVQPAPELVEA